MEKTETKINIERKWYLFDAKEKILGRLSTKAANILRGKNKVSFTNNSDVGDYVVIINAEKIVLTGKKEEQKRYYRHTSYIGNLKVNTVSQLRKDKPDLILKKSINGMLPKNKLRASFMSRLKIYKGNNHPHQNVKFVNLDK